MRIGLVTPAPPRSLYGNRITALRWAGILRELGHRVTVAEAYGGERYDLLVALHARRSHAAIRAFRRQCPGSPIVVALTGTDLYRDMRRSASARASVEMATRLVVLQPNALDELDELARRKARVIIQSVSPPPRPGRGLRGPGRGRAAPTFDVCVVGHLRHVKDPFRAAMAARLLPAASRVRIVHIGSAMTEAMGRRARTEMERNARYVWLGERSPAEVWRTLASSRVSVLSSRMEGGANAIGESVVAGTPVIASRIAGNVGLLGETYPGYFAVGNTRELAELLDRAERDPAYLADLGGRSAALAPRFDPARETEAWAALLDEIGSPARVEETRP
jgi:putative glycosyltransferase (TIGR04348 family)